MPVLEVLICTIDDGINNIAKHIAAPVDSVRYLISWQQTGNKCRPVPQCLKQRSDIRILNPRSIGLSANRNHALQHAEGDILLLSDDDASYRPSYFATVLESFKNNPDADILIFQMIDENGKLMKNYSSATYVYSQRPKFSYVSTLEIALRRSSVNLRFDTRFGIGSEYLSCGEEEVFIHQAYLSGLQIKYIPQVIVQTPKNTTGSKFFTLKNVRHAKGAVLFIIHGYAGALLRCLKYAMTLKVCFKQRFLFFKDMYDGIQYIRTNSK